MNTIELLLVCPILVAVLLAIVQFSMILSAQARLAAASREGARAAATGHPQGDVYLAIERVLGQETTRQSTILIHPHFSDSNPLNPGEPVHVRIKVKAGVVAPDLLRFVGLKIGEKELIGQTVMRVE